MPLNTGDPGAIGEYVLLDRLGTGGMGAVFLGRSQTGRQVAVKVVHAQYAQDPEFRTRFRQEIEAARRVSGAFTASVVDADPDADRPWMATLYVPGRSLAGLVDKGGPLDGASLRALALGLAEALRDIHRAGVVHRDLKPANVLMAEDGPRVIDFGISRAAGNEPLTVTGNVIGTPPFMSPEQLRSARGVTTASDVFSLGSLLAYAASGHGPFDADTPYMAGYHVMYEEPRLDLVAEPLRGIVAHCLDKDPAARPTVPELRELFRALPDELQPLSADVIAGGGEAETETEIGGAGLRTHAEAAPRQPGRGRGRRLLIVLGAAAAVTGLTVAGVFALGLGGLGGSSAGAGAHTASLPAGFRAWQTTLRHTVSAEDAPAVGDGPGCVTGGGDLYCGGEGFTLARVDPATGRVKWRVGVSAQDVTPFGVRDGLVYVPVWAGGGWKVAALDTANGKQRWVAANPQNHRALLFDGGLLTATGDARGFVAYNTAGKALWKTQVPSYCLPMVAGGDPYAECTTGNDVVKGPVTVQRLDRADGTAHKLATLPAGATGLGAYDGQLLYAVSGALLHLDPDTGAVRRQKLEREVSGTPALLDGTVYFTGTNGTVTAVSAATGKQLWQQATGLENLSAPVLSAAYGRLYFATRIGSVLALDRDGGTELWRTAALDSTGAEDEDWPVGVLLVKDAIVTMAGLTAFSVSPDQPSVTT
ncbi:serine/threonine-protein kinase [Streptomyces sp. NBC_01537]|uniref:serine/threonine-protein kinase n=1 Tax=Streptomyces sp. NBC_01537 TaxID=2903896 RepID=UPI00386CEDDD